MNHLSPVILHKLSATENDFIVVGLLRPEVAEQWNKDFASIERSKLAKIICHRTAGIGADGLIILEAAKDADYKWDFYNSDGSHAEMCGNAARCVALWANRQDPQRTQFKFATAAGLIGAQLLADGRVCVDMPMITEVKQIFSYQGLAFRRIDSGVPHAVAEIPQPPVESALRVLAESTRHAPVFEPRGTNVTFYFPTGPGQIKALTFERGVENFTRACGTGAVAAAYAYGAEHKFEKILVDLPGGQLTVILSSPRPQLIGMAQWVADLQFHIHATGEVKT